MLAVLSDPTTPEGLLDKLERHMERELFFVASEYGKDDPVVQVYAKTLLWLRQERAKLPQRGA